MSKNRLKKKVSIAPSHNEQVFQAVKKHHEDDVSATNSRRKAAFIWDEFQQMLHKLALEEKLFAEHIPRHLNDLGARIEKEVKHEGVRKATLDMIDMKIADMAKYNEQFRLVMANTVIVIAHCPHENNINGVHSFCDWTARVRLDRHEFEAGTAIQECNSCSKPITTSDMTLPPA